MYLLIYLPMEFWGRESDMTTWRNKETGKPGAVTQATSAWRKSQIT